MKNPIYEHTHGFQAMLLMFLTTSENLSDDEEPADYVGMLLGYWLRRDKKLPEQYRSAKKLCEVLLCRCGDYGCVAQRCPSTGITP
jgi:hypothetical protein